MAKSPDCLASYPQGGSQGVGGDWLLQPAGGRCMVLQNSPGEGSASSPPVTGVVLGEAVT